MEEKTGSSRLATARRIALVTMLVLTLTLIVIGQAGAQGPIVYPDASGVHFFPKMPGTGPITPMAPAFGGVAVTVNSPAAGAQNETSIAINPTNPANLIAGANDYRGADTACGSYFSTDNGATWTDNTPLAYEAGFAASGDPGMAFDSAGHGFYLCMNFNRNANDATQYVYKSFDGGNNWGPGILAAGSPRANFDDKGHIAVDARAGSAFNGNVYVAFARLNTGDIRFNRSVDGGNSFTGCPGACADIAVNDVNGGSGANLAVGAAGSVYLGWNRNYNNGTNDRAEIRIDKSTDGGVNFNALGGDVVIADFIRDSTGSGRPAVRPLARVNFFPSFGADPTNDNIVYAVWMDDVPGNDDSDIYFSRSTNGGANWSAPKRINDDVNPVGDFHSQFFPWLSVDPVDGEIDIVWYDDRNDANRTDGTPLVDLYFASSSDQGVSFSNNLRVTATSSDLTTDFAGGFFGDYNAIASFGGVAHPFWTDSSSGEQQVVTTAVGGADLSITKTDTPDPVAAGQSLRYDISVTNAGPAAAFNVRVTDPLPAGVTFQSSAPACTLSAGTLTCNLGNLAKGATASLTIQVLVNANAVAGSGTGSITNTATVASDQEDPNTSNNSATATTIVNESADLRISKDCKPDRPSTVPAGVEAVCTITVDNLGPSDARNVTVVDAHVSNGVFNFGTITPGTCVASPNPQNGSGTVTCNLGTIAAGTSVIIKVPVSGLEPQDINDQATVSSSTPDPNPANNQAQDGVTVSASSDLSVTKTDSPDPVVAGTNLTYDLTITNAGPSAAVNTVVRDMLPAGVTIVSVTSSGGTCNAGQPGNAAMPTVCTFDTIASGASKTMQIVVTVLPGTTGILHNDASVYSANFDPNNANDLASTDTTVVGQADLSITKTDNPDPAVAGQKLTYEITIANGGPSTARTVTLTDQLPAEVTYTSATITNGSGACVLQNVPPNTVFCNLNDLDPGQYVKVFIDTMVKASVLQGTVIVNTATAGSATADPNLANNTATASTTINAVADLRITKDGRADYTNPAPRVVFTLVVTNLGPSDAQNVTLTDPLPLTAKKLPFLFYTGYGPAAGQCQYTLATHTFSCSFGLVAAGDSRTVDLWLDARGSVGVITNIASTSSATTDPVTGNNSARKDVKIKGGPGPK